MNTGTTAIGVKTAPMHNSKFGLLSEKSLNFSIGLWFLVVIVGQWIFTFYILMVYGGSALRGNFEVWTEILPVGFTPGDPMGNAALMAHVFFAAIINGGGALQLIPFVRNRFPVFHRWNGRVFVVAAFIASLGGVYMTFTRETVGGTALAIGNVSLALLIIVCGLLAWREAWARRFERHRRWALRLFLVVSANWFFRLGILLWYAFAGGIGIEDETFTGPFITFWAFGQYLLPLAILELYLITRKRAGMLARFGVALLLTIVAVAIGAGLFMMTAGYWIPLIEKY